MPYFGDLFGPNTSKEEVSAKIKLSFLRFNNNVTSLKKSEGNQSTTPMKNVELTD